MKRKWTLACMGLNLHLDLTNDEAKELIEKAAGNQVLIFGDRYIMSHAVLSLIPAEESPIAVAHEMPRLVRGDTP